MRGDRAPQVFDLTADPRERNDQAAAHPVLIGYARQRMAELEAGLGGSVETQALEASHHVITLDVDRAQVFASVERHLRRTCG